MSHVGVPRGTAQKRKRLPALLTAGVLTLPALAGCSSDGDETAAVAAVPQDVARAARAQIADGGKVTWAIDALPATLNAFQADADSATTRITGALLPTLFPLDDKGRPQLNPDYLESAKVTETEPRQVVVYRLNQQAVWSDGREIGAPDFVAQWRALSGKDSAFWTARNAGYERIEKIERGSDDLEVKVTFAKPYADWRSLFSPLYPKQVTGSPDAFNDGARTTVKETAGPFRLREVDKRTGSVTLTRNPRWWGSPAKLDSLVFKAVKPEDRTDALAEGTVDVADVDSGTAHRIAQAAREGAAGASGAHGPGAALTPAQALRSWAVAHGTDEEAAEEEQKVRDDKAEAAEAYATEQSGLRAFTVRKALEPAYTQLALNGETGPLADDRVRRAVARALDRQELADTVLKPLGLPAQPLGSHLAVAGQPAYKDGSEALGKQDTEKAQALLADAGWTREGALSRNDGTKAGSEGEKKKDADTKAEEKKAEEKKAEEKKAEEKKGSAGKESEGDDGKADRAAGEPSAADGLYIVGDDKPGDATRVLAPAPVAAAQSDALLRQAGRLGATGISEDARDVRAQDRQPGGAAGAYAPAGTAAPADGADAAGGPLGKNGKPLSLRFVLPSGPGSAGLRSVGEKIAAMLDTIGIRTVITKVSDDSYFRDHVASGDYDMALYSWPASAYPATDDRPIYAKPVPATDGSLLVEQNYTRVGTDHIDQLFDQAVSELDEKASQNLMRQADARIWAAAGSIPLFQRPQLVATARTLVNVGAFGFGVPHYQDIGYKAPQAAGAPATRKK
ncbi:MULTISPECIES: ABC transporter family substrate-binding protein [unclassified Streptomyces]|uniref:ABC transporter family substrate-binding protein n=1 Tax=unclassified Streptomyces TaxID=2593676 RepID=UPI002ED67A13|nr:ABC transporter family substrate-binding protein [Streptomyces sp. NBC_00891]WSY07563.1 ABC transporter family substrate-binding protein [Streptomyces sp. NBC_00890]WSZ09189.1 ABC transporter family substrate-binding protein [Streptomyces sp. NBC_00869]WSZ23312.1 ABC transporter family substrate-binding protein [Streptomyces sp. NBC_00870]